MERTLRLGLLNMMADGALRPTEQQFQRLVPGVAARHVRWSVFSLPELARGESARRYIARNYCSFEQAQQEDLDALIITGVNLSDPRLEIQPFWDPLAKVMAWAQEHVASVLCSCLASHAVLQFRFGQRRRRGGQKLWGVFLQEVVPGGHPLTRGLPERVAVPHSRHNDVSAEQFGAAGLAPLIQGGGAGVHLAATADLQLVLMQGHPEYDTISLLKEYKREVGFYHAGIRPDYPPLPVNYLTPRGVLLAEDHQRAVAGARLAGQVLPPFPEADLEPHLINLWAEPAARLFANWRDYLMR